MPSGTQISDRQHAATDPRSVSDVLLTKALETSNYGNDELGLARFS